ncbi:hypothetical protein LSI54_09125 [Nesterenkonia sp. AY15]|uniref:hypothetical protein n=1 Tax=Nesterenkonia sp. AY15 TaxID=2901139 RepID=UPI001F4CE2A4|nr:hypothetical protein [Nesterenkonia sp. AY15]MCH8571512.1 hypothetical protein [Nesterenkonia sp. AY15]
MRAQSITGLGLVALLALAGCGGNDEGAEEAQEAPEQAETEAPVEEAGEPAEDDSEPLEAETDEPVNEDMAAEDPGEPDDSLDSITYEVGETFRLASMDGMGTAEITYEGFEWVEPERVAGEENYGMALFSVAVEGDMPVQLPAPIDGGGWHYVTADGEMQSLYNLIGNWSNTWGGYVQHMYSGPFTPGVTESNLIEEMVLPERGGQLVHVDGTGMIEAYLEVPDESANGDNPAIDEVYEIADADWGGEVASP